MTSSHAGVVTRRRQVFVALAVVCIAVAAWLVVEGRGVGGHARAFRVGFQNSPPNQMVTPDGKPEGPAIEIFAEAARRRHIPLEWVLCPDGPDKNLTNGKVDLWPLLTDFPERHAKMYLTPPWTANTYWMVALKSSGIRTPADTAGRDVWYRQGPVDTRFAGKNFPAAKLHPAADDIAIFTAVLDGRAAAGQLAGNATRYLTLRSIARPHLDELNFYFLNDTNVTLGIGAALASPGARHAADEIHGAMGEMAKDGTISSIYYRWFLDPSNESVALFYLRDVRRQEGYLAVIIGALGLVLALLGWLGLHLRREVRERARVAAALQSSQGFLNSLVENLPACVFSKDEASRFTFANRLYCEAQHVALSDLLGKTDADFYPAEVARKFHTDEARIMATRQPSDTIQEQPLANGESRLLQVIKVPLVVDDGQVLGTVGMYWDVTDRERAAANLRQAKERAEAALVALRKAEQEREDLNRQLLETSRQAGMAEIASGILHNVGNVLNSVNVSATLVLEKVQHTKAVGVAKLAALLEEHQVNLGEFIAHDARGQRVPVYLTTLAASLAEEQRDVVTELQALRANIDHIKAVVAMQQEYARTSGVVETVSVPDLVEDALRINAGSLARHAVDIRRDYAARPVITTDKHKVMQILINLVRNAKYACDESGRPDKRIALRITADEVRVRIAIIDNGVGIPAENLVRIFSHGFTTRANGHGFGLHSGAIAAKEIGGSLSAQSDGPGQGATFILEIPFKAVQEPP